MPPFAPPFANTVYAPDVHTLCLFSTAVHRIYAPGALPLEKVSAGGDGLEAADMLRLRIFTHILPSLCVLGCVFEHFPLVGAGIASYINAEHAHMPYNRSILACKNMPIFPKCPFLITFQLSQAVILNVPSNRPIGLFDGRSSKPPRTRRVVRWLQMTSAKTTAQ